jgi:hypothetical protein
MTAHLDKALLSAKTEASDFDAFSQFMSFEETYFTVVYVFQLVRFTFAV